MPAATMMVWLDCREARRRNRSRALLARQGQKCLRALSALGRMPGPHHTVPVVLVYWECCPWCLVLNNDPPLETLSALPKLLDIVFQSLLMLGLRFENHSNGVECVKCARVIFP